MKPFVAIGRVLDEVSDVVQHLHSVDDCAKTENLYSAVEAVPGPAGCLGCFLSRTASHALYRFLCLSQSASKMYDFVAAGAPFFSFRTS